MNRIPEVVDLASDAAFAIDERCRVVAWNQRATQLLGYAQSDVTGRYCGSILRAVLPGGEPLCSPSCELFQCFHNSRPSGVASCRIRRKNGDWLTARYSSLVTSKQSRQKGDDSVVAVIFLQDENEELVHELPQQTLQVFTLGSFGLSMGGSSVALDKWVRKQAVTLLKFLITQTGRPVHRERILCCLWPDADASRGWARLKVTISYLRLQLRNMGMSEDTLTTVGKAYLLRHDTIRVDAEDFEALIAEGRTLQSQQRNDAALRRYVQADYLYRGDYLEEENFADWCAEERERLRELYLEMISDMVQCYMECGDYAEDARLCRKALVQEPCRESFHRLLMECFDYLGHTDQALSQYEACRRVLAKELSVDPMPKTQRIYQKIKSNRLRNQERLVPIRHLDQSVSCMPRLARKIS